MTTTPEEMAVASDGAIATAPAATRVSTGIVRVNLIPAEIAEARALRATAIAAGGAALVAVAIVGLLYHGQQDKVSDAKAQLATAQAENAKLMTTQATLGNVDALYAKVDAAEGMIAQAKAPKVLFSRYLEDLRLQLPDHIWLTSIAATETPATGAAATGAAATGANASTAIGTLTFAGSGYTHNDVADLLVKMAGLRGLSNPYLSNSTEALVGTGPSAIPTVTWAATANLDSDALKSSYDNGTATP